MQPKRLDAAHVLPAAGSKFRGERVSMLQVKLAKGSVSVPRSLAREIILSRTTETATQALRSWAAFTCPVLA